jgi:hypothetical protein
MQTVICFPVPDSNRKICVNVPVAIIRDWGLPHPDPGPWKGPIDWILSQEASPEPWKVDLPILATIERLASQLHTQEIRAHVGRAVEDAFHGVAADLPSGIRLERKKLASKAA